MVREVVNLVLQVKFTHTTFEYRYSLIHQSYFIGGIIIRPGRSAHGLWILSPELTRMKVPCHGAGLIRAQARRKSKDQRMPSGNAKPNPFPPIKNTANNPLKVIFWAKKQDWLEHWRVSYVWYCWLCWGA